MNVAPETPVRGRPRDPRRREAILRAAIVLVAEVGYDRVTVDALAARAGVSKPTIYRRWPGGKKESIVDAIRSKHVDADSLPDAGSLRGDLLSLLGTMIEHIDQDAHLAAGLISQLRDSEELATLMREEIATLERRRYDVLIARAVGAYQQVQSTEFGDLRPAVVARDGGTWRLHRRREEIADLIIHDREEPSWSA